MSKNISIANAQDSKTWKPNHPSQFDTKEELTPFKDITSYNNFYEFGVDKDDPAQYAGTMKTQPWSVAVDGYVKQPAVYHLEDILKGESMRRRLVDGHSVAWIPAGQSHQTSRAHLQIKVCGFPNAKFAPDEMPGQRTSALRWPYVKGLDWMRPCIRYLFTYIWLDQFFD